MPVVSVGRDDVAGLGLTCGWRERRVQRMVLGISLV